MQNIIATNKLLRRYGNLLLVKWRSSVILDLGQSTKYLNVVLYITFWIT